MAPIHMGIDLYQRHLFVLGQSTQDRDGDTVITAKRDQCRAGLKDLSGRHFRLAIMLVRIEFIRCYIAAINDLDRAIIQKWTA